MEVYLEYLYHHGCDNCARWWTVGDIQPVQGKTTICPHCGHTNTVEVIRDGLSLHQFNEVKP